MSLAREHLPRSSPQFVAHFVVYVTTMDPAEVEFLAEKEIVKIIPNFSLDKIYLIGVSTFYGSLLLSEQHGVRILTIASLTLIGSS